MLRFTLPYLVVLDMSHVCRFVPSKPWRQKWKWEQVFWRNCFFRLSLVTSRYIFYHCCIVRMRCDSMHQSNSMFCVSFSLSHFFGSGSAEFRPLSTPYLQVCLLAIDSIMSQAGISTVYLVHSFFIFTTRPTVWRDSDNAIISSYWKFLLS